MKELKVALCVPTTGNCKTGWAMSITALGAYIVSRQMLPEVQTQEMAPFWKESSSIVQNRHDVVRDALEWGATHILMLDEDLFFHPRAVEIMLGRRLPVVGLNYPMRAEGAGFTALALDRERRVWSGPETTGIEPCWYLPQGGTLIEAGVYRKIKPPWFQMEWVEHAQMYTTEDKFFFDRVRTVGYLPHVDHDASHLVEHIGNKHFRHTEVKKDVRGSDPCNSNASHADDGGGRSSE